MSPEQPSLDEHRHLYAEIGRNSQISQNVFLGNVAVTSGLIGYGLDSQSGPIFLAPFAIIIPSLFFLSSQLESTTRIAAYIVVFLEQGSSDLNWEGRWLSLRESGLLPRRRKYTLSLSGLYGLVSLVCILLACRYWQGDPKWFFVVVFPIVSLVATGIKQMLSAFSIHLMKEYIAAWESIRL